MILVRPPDDRVSDDRVSDDAPAGSPAAPPAAVGAGPVPRIEIVGDLAAAAPAWRELAEQGLGTPFQRLDWVSAWQRHVGTPAGMRPVVVIGRNARGAPAFLWPFAVGRAGPLAVARFPGCNHAGFGMGVWRPEAAAAVTAEEVARTLAAVARAEKIDVFSLERQPRRWHGMDNPFAGLPTTPSIDDVVGATFPPGDVEAVLAAVMTRDMRSRLRNKERKLAKLPGYRYLRAGDAAEAERLLTAFLAQKAAQFAAQNLPDVFAEPGVTDFLRTACREGVGEGMPAIELHALVCDAEVIAVMGGVADRRGFSCMFNAYTASENGRWSPGLVLITHIVADCAARGLTGFDLGPGAASYKTFFCREPAGLVDTLLPVSAKGRAGVAVLTGLRAAKRRIKASPRLLALVQRLRRAAGRSSGSSPDPSSA